MTIRLPAEFATKLHDTISAGTTVIVTDQPVVRKPTRDAAYFGT
jgi:hypothetical protein